VMVDHGIWILNILFDIKLLEFIFKNFSAIDFILKLLLVAVPNVDQSLFV
jgi:hypothetical protein